MGAQPFRFKQFVVHQVHATHKVGTDGVLLGAWLQILQNDNYILDIGTGSALIALMLAQRSAPLTRIDAVEIEKLDAEQAWENVLLSPWPEKIKIHNIAVQQFSGETHYDLIVSNPPFFVNSWLPPEKKRSQARHTHHLSFQDLLSAATRLLKPGGRLALILPYLERVQFIELARTYNLFPIREGTFRSRAHKPVERILLELSQVPREKTKDEIILYSEGENWSDAYKQLTREFYIKI
jgi:tRNA1Val (adenine37-N6)-methyltransferase